MQTERGFVLHESILVAETISLRPVYASTMMIPGGLEMTTSRDVLEALSTGSGPAQGAGVAGLFGLGRRPAGVRTGREQLADGGGRRPADFRHAGDQRYAKALTLLGLEAWMLSPGAGHA